MAKLKKNQNCLLSVHMLKMILDLFISTFLVSHIISQTPESILGQGIFNIGLFYLFWHLSYGILDYICSYFVDKGNRALFLRIGIAVNMLLIIALVFWGEQISEWLILAGMICGTADAFYYSSYLVMRTELIGRQSTKQYNMLATVFTNVIKVVIPVIMGYIIEASTLSGIAIYIAIICFAQLIISLFIKADKPENSKFEFDKYIRYLKSNKDDWNKIKYTYINTFIAGFKTTYNILVVILTVYIFKTNSLLGIYTSLFSLATMICLILYKKADSNKHFNKFIIYLMLGALPFISCVVVIFFTNNITLIILNFLLTISSYFSDYLGTVERDAIIKNLNQHDFIAEHQVMTEVIQVSGRIIAFSIFLIVGLTADLVVFKIMLFAFLMINPLKFFVMYKQRLVRKEFEKNLSV